MRQIIFILVVLVTQISFAGTDVQTEHLRYTHSGISLRLGYQVHFLEKDILVGRTVLMKELNDTSVKTEAQSLPKTLFEAQEILSRSLQMAPKLLQGPSAKRSESLNPEKVTFSISAFQMCLKQVHPLLLLALGQKDPAEQKKTLLALLSFRGKNGQSDDFGFPCGAYLKGSVPALDLMTELKVVTYLLDLSSYDYDLNILCRAYSAEHLADNPHVYAAYLNYRSLRSFQKSLKDLAFDDFAQVFYPQLGLKEQARVSCF